MTATVNINNEVIKDWTQEQKFRVLQVIDSGLLCPLQVFNNTDDNDIRAFEDFVGRPRQDIEAALAYYISIAKYNVELILKKEEEEKREKETGEGTADVNKQKQHPTSSSGKNANGPLMEWEKRLKMAFTPDQLHTETSTAIRLIADCENIPPKEESDGIDFKKVYHTIADVMEGKLNEIDGASAEVLKYCLAQTAQGAKESQTPQMMDFLNTLQISNNGEPPCSTAGVIKSEEVEDVELEILKHLSGQINYNPLKIPLEILKGVAIEKPKNAE